MEELTLSQEDVAELLTILHESLYDAETAKRLSRELEMIDSVEEHHNAIRKWIRRLSQFMGSELEQEAEE